MYAAAGGASLAGRKARQHGRLPAPPSPRPPSPPHPAPTGVRAYSCQHWESRLLAPPRNAEPCDLVEAVESHWLSFLCELFKGQKLASMQAALMLRSKSRERRKQRLKRGIKHELPSNVATKGIAPFPRYPPASWCAAGRAAWQEAAALAVGAGAAGAGGAARRCSVLGDHPGARRDNNRAKWPRNNRVRDASYGSSSDSDGEVEGPNGEPWGVASLLYAGLGILALGLVVYFVGTGDKGFKTPALRMVGPSLIFTGLGCCLLRIAFCVFAKPCCRRPTIFKESRRLSGCGEGEEMPLAGGGGGGGSGSRVGPAQCSPARRLDTSSCDVSSLSSGEEDERLRRYRITSVRTPTLRQTTSSQSTVHQSSVPESTSQHAMPSAAQSLLQTPLTPEMSSLQIPNIPSPSAHHASFNVLHNSVIPCAISSAIAIASTSAVPSSSAIPSTSAILTPIPIQRTSAIPSASAIVPTCATPKTSAIPSTSATSSSSAISRTSAIPGTSATSSTSALPRTSATPRTNPIPSTSAVPSTSGMQSISAIPSTSANVPSSLHHTGQRRLPPRNVSFANGADDELVLSPAQLRS